ncbi:MAG: lipopolysaccharide biosynthesis protein [Candidatus Thermoplasmatota archaeon]|nr:lipopolysaccharide biosynthesis protein [Candidatus Thermoplasmatota archaeon]
MTRRVRLERDTFWLTAADLVALLVGLAVHIVLTRSFTDGDYGRWVLLLDLFYVTATFVDLGLPTLIGRDGERLGSGAKDLVHRCLDIQIRVALPIIIISGLLGWIWIGESTTWLVASLILAVSAGVQILTYAHRAALRALGESRKEALVRFVDRGATAMGIVLAASLLGAHPIALALATLLGPIGAMGIAISLGERRLSDVENGEKLETSTARGRQLINLGLPFLIAAIALVANVRIEKLMLGALSTTDSLEIYQIAWLAFIAGYAPVLSLRAVMLSWFGEVRNEREKMWHRAKRATTLIAIFSIPGYLIGGWIGVEAIVAVFPDYSDKATTVFTWLLLAWVLALIASVPLTLVQVSESPLRYATLLWSGIIADFIACWILIPESDFPAKSAAFAAIIGATVVLFLSTIEAWRFHSSSSTLVAEP